MSFQQSGERFRDQQDGDERMIWDEIEYISDAGAILKVKGTGTEDQEVILANNGFGFNIPASEDSEVLVTSMGSDTNLKYGVPQIPAKNQRQWAENTGGVQSPLDPEKAVEFNEKRTWVTEQNFAVGQGLFEIINGVAYFRIPVVFEQAIEASSTITTDGEITAPVFDIGNANANVPGFDE